MFSPPTSSVILSFYFKAEDKAIFLRLIINPELENKLLSYGEQIEVLSPESLRKTMKKRLVEAGKQYGRN